MSQDYLAPKVRREILVLASQEKMVFLVPQVGEPSLSDHEFRTTEPTLSSPPRPALLYNIIIRTVNNARLATTYRNAPSSRYGARA